MVRAWDDQCALELYEGDPAAVITRIAKQAGAAMIVAGLGHHRVGDCVFGDETALRLIRMASVPVFAAAVGFHHPARRIVVAMDFSETSFRAARMALQVAASGATIYFVHVALPEGSVHDAKKWRTTYRRDAEKALLNARTELAAPQDMRVRTALVEGDPATELLALASHVNADLIVIGSHGNGFIARMVIGRVTTQIVRCATCSVLTVPCVWAIGSTQRARGVA
jgi:nucleotide-binding universal stress UspA family protein